MRPPGSAALLDGPPLGGRRYSKHAAPLKAPAAAMPATLPRRQAKPGITLVQNVSIERSSAACGTKAL